MNFPADIRVGTTIQDRYRIIERIASGAMGVVYQAERLHLGRKMAIKFLHSEIAANPKFKHRFEMEARSMSLLSHPNCVSIIDFGVADAPYLVMDFITGRTLADLLYGKRLPVIRALGLVQQILAGLSHAHKKGIVHRDLKPANIIVDEDVTGTGDYVRILDFGLAKLCNVDASISSVDGHYAIGTPSYMSPEQTNADPVDERSDLYSVGVILFEMLAGKRPFCADSPIEVMRLQRFQPPPSIRKVAPKVGLSRKIDALILKALDKAPNRRFQSAGDFTESLKKTPEFQKAAIKAEKPSPISTPTKKLRAAKPSRSTTPPPTVSQQDSKTATTGSKTRRQHWWFLVLMLMAVGAAMAWTEPGKRLRNEIYQWIETHQNLRPFDKLVAKGNDLELQPDGSIRADIRTMIARTERTKTRKNVEPGDARVDQPPGDARVDQPPALLASRTDLSLSDSKDDSGDSGERTVDNLSKDSSDPTGEGKDPQQNATRLSPSGQTPPPNTPPPVKKASLRKASHKTSRSRKPPPLIVKVRKIISSGNLNQKIGGIRRLHYRYPRNAFLLYLLGKLYFRKHYISDALKMYRQSIKLNRDYRKMFWLINNTISALDRPKTSGKATRLIMNHIGPAALPQLQRAARRHRSSNVRRHAKMLIQKLH